MAKKGAVQQLQAEINSDDDFEKFMDKPGLLVMDVYTEWCGPCLGMLGSLKKIKLELGGDNLHLAICKSDHISFLERFRNKSEPTWLFGSHKKIVNCLFGTNVPELMALIEAELIFDERYRNKEIERTFYEWTELTAVEQERENARLAIEEERSREERALETQKKNNYIEFVTDMITERQADAGVTFILPNYAKVKDFFKKLTEPADKCGLIIKDRRMIQIKPEDLEIIHYECENPMHDAIYKDLFNEEILAIFWKTHDNELRDVIECLGLFVDSVCIAQPLMDDFGNPDPVLKMPPIFKPYKIEADASLFVEELKNNLITNDNKSNDHVEEVASQTEPHVAFAGFENTSNEELTNEVKAESQEENTASEQQENPDSEQQVNPDSEQQKNPASEQQEPTETNEATAGEGSINDPAEIDSQGRRLSQITEPIVDLGNGRVLLNVLPIYCARNKRANSAIIYLYFRNLTDHFLPPDPVPEPQHVCVVFDAFKRKDVMTVFEKFPGAVLAYGFFNSMNPDTAVCLAKNIDLYSELKPTIEDKMIIKVAKVTSHALLAFAGLGPTYVSFSTKEGFEECSKYFPKDYNEEEEEDENASVGSNSSKKKKKKRRSKIEGEEVVPGTIDTIGEELEVVEEVENEEAPASAEGEEVVAA